VRTTVPGPCPSCNTEIEYLYQTENIPYFSDILIISATCPACGYRYVDTQLLKEADPVRYEMPVTSAADLDVRVIRSMSGELVIPELGVRIDPGPACEGFVTNVEGVLARIERIVEGTLLWANDDERERAKQILADIKNAREGTLPLTLILQDVRGNSVIIADTAQKIEYRHEPEC
jgi:zinc finger protein